MKKNRNFQLICLILVFALTLILSGGNVLSAQGIDVKVKKPKPPPVEEKWGARIPSSDLNLIYGIDSEYIYEDSIDPALTVSVYKYNYNSRGRKGYRYDFSIRIVPNDNDIYLGIQNVPELTEIRPEEAEGTPCGFPEPCNTNPPDCLECFLEGMHPRDGYAMMLLSFSIHDYEILDMKPGDTKNISRLNLSLWNSIDNTVDEYHSIITTFWPMGELNEDIYLIKSEDVDEDNVWTLVVDKAVFGAYEYYRIATNPAQAHSYYPLRTQANDPVNMQIDWIKLKE